MNIVLLLEQTEFMLRKFDSQREDDRLQKDPDSVMRKLLTYLQEKLNQLIAYSNERKYL